MLVGHFAAALIAKGVHPRLSLGAALAAAVLPDVLLFAFVLAGIEYVQFRASSTPGPAFTGGDIALSHSLATTAAWGAAVAGAYFWRCRDRWGAFVLFAIIVSHWVLDVISHRPVMPVAPGTLAYVASRFSAWLLLPMAVEGALWTGALILYVRDSRSTNSAGRYVFWGGIVSWTYVWYVNAYGPPRRPEDGPIEGLILLLLAIGWGYWMNRARVMKTRGAEIAETI